MYVDCHQGTGAMMFVSSTRALSSCPAHTVWLSVLLCSCSSSSEAACVCVDQVVCFRSFF